MHSHEIKELLKLKKNIISYAEYLRIADSPQIDHIKYEDEMFRMWTTDGYKFEFKIQAENKS